MCICVSVPCTQASVNVNPVWLCTFVRASARLHSYFEKTCEMESFICYMVPIGMDLQYKGLLQRCFLCVSPVNHTVIHIVRPLIETRMYLCLLCTKLERETCPDDKRNE